MDVALADQVRDPAGQDARLARPRAGDDQHRTALVQHRLALGRVEPVEQLLGRESIPPPGTRLSPLSPQGVRQGTLLTKHGLDPRLDGSLLHFTHGLTTLSAPADCSMMPLARRPPGWTATTTFVPCGGGGSRCAASSSARYWRQRRCRAPPC